MEVERVQALASMSTLLETIPSEFVRPETEQPGTTTFNGPMPDIPVIDLSHPDHDHVIRAMSAAAKEWGIFQVVNHGIPAEVITELQRVGKEFFELPSEEKEKYATVPESGSFEGYGTNLKNDFDGKKAWADFFFHNIFPPSRVNYNVWPKNPPFYRDANEEYAKYLPAVVDEVLGCLSEGIGLEKGELRKAVGGDDLELLLKINYYPPCPRPDLALGVVAHTDMSAVTVLVPNEVPGLQICKDDVWFDAKYIPDALIIHVGDQIEILTNGKYKSVLHRTTVNKDKVRMSWPVFCSPPAEMVVGPLPVFVNEENPARFKTKEYKDYSYCKLNMIPQ